MFRFLKTQFDDNNTTEILVNSVGGVMCQPYNGFASEYRPFVEALKEGRTIEGFFIRGDVMHMSKKQGKKSKKTKSSGNGPRRSFSQVVDIIELFLIQHGPTDVSALGGMLCGSSRLSKVEWQDFVAEMRVYPAIGAITGEPVSHTGGMIFSVNHNIDYDDDDFYGVLDPASVDRMDRADPPFRYQPSATGSLAKDPSSWETVVVGGHDSQSILNAVAALGNEKIVGVDCSGHNDAQRLASGTGLLRLVTISAPLAGTIFIFDAGTGGDWNAFRDVWLVFAVDDIIKVFHDCRNTVPVLKGALGESTPFRAVFDTQVAFEVLVRQQAVTKQYKGARASLDNVLDAFQLPCVDSVTGEDSDNFWMTLVIPSDSLKKAAARVRFLVQAHRKILECLDARLCDLSLMHSEWHEHHHTDEERKLNVEYALAFDDLSNIVLSDCGSVDEREDAEDVDSGEIDDDRLVTEFLQFADALPAPIARHLKAQMGELLHSLVEVVIDVGERPSVRTRSGATNLPDECVVSLDDMMDMKKRWKAAGLSIGDDNRVALERSLHRISVLRGRDGKQLVGMTARMGRHCRGSAELLLDVLARVARGDASLLLVGPPGSGKTTLLRECALQLASNRFGQARRVHVVDSSCEIAGDGAVKHPAIGNARRTMVPHNSSQAEMMREVVQNHTPDIIIIDEIGDADQAKVAGSIRQRGVVMVATAHGGSLSELRGNSELNSLLGGFGVVTLGDAEQKAQGAASKSVTERKGRPTFDILVEITGIGQCTVHDNVSESVDALLAQPKSKHPPAIVSRRWMDAKSMRLRFEPRGGSGHVAAKVHKSGQMQDGDWLAQLV